MPPSPRCSLPTFYPPVSRGPQGHPVAAGTWVPSCCMAVALSLPLPFLLPSGSAVSRGSRQLFADVCLVPWIQLGLPRSPRAPPQPLGSTCTGATLSLDTGGRQLCLLGSPGCWLQGPGPPPVTPVVIAFPPLPPFSEGICCPRSLYSGLLLSPGLSHVTRTGVPGPGNLFVDTSHPGPKGSQLRQKGAGGSACCWQGAG